MLAKHKLLGVTLMLGGAIMAYALSVKPKSSEPSAQKTLVHTAQESQITTKTLAADIDTETKILLERQKEREARVRAQEEQMKSLIAQQELARAEALKKAEAETTTNLVIKPRPEVVAAQKAQEQKQQEAQEPALKPTQTPKPERKPAEVKPQAKSNPPNESEKPVLTKTTTNEDTAKTNKTEPKNTERHQVRRGDNLIRLAREYQVPVPVLAQANNLQPEDTLKRGSQLKIPNKNEIKALQAKVEQQEKAKALQKLREEKQKSINQRLSQARQEAKKQGLNEGYSVQVALATDQQKAQELSAKYKKAGYQVRLVEEGRGVRVVIGKERSQAAASVLKEKLQNDPNVAASGAWVTKVK